MPEGSPMALRDSHQAGDGESQRGNRGHPCPSPDPAEQLSPLPSYSPGHPHRLHRVLALLAGGDVLHALGEPVAAGPRAGPRPRRPPAALPERPCARVGRPQPGPAGTRSPSGRHQQRCGKRSVRGGRPRGSLRGAPQQNLRAGRGGPSPAAAPGVSLATGSCGEVTGVVAGRAPFPPPRGRPLRPPLPRRPPSAAAMPRGACAPLPRCMPGAAVRRTGPAGRRRCPGGGRNYNSQRPPRGAEPALPAPDGRGGVQGTTRSRVG